MSKKLVFSLTLATVLITVLSSGPFIGARADDIGPMCWAGSCPAQQSDMDQARRDMDKPDATCQGAYQYGPTVPQQMGGPGL